MHDFPRQKLCELVNHHGIILSEDAKRCESLLRDVCEGEYKREIFALIHAIKEGVTKDLLNSPRGLPQEEMFARLVQRLHDNLGLDKILAEWVVQSWEIALGVKVAISLENNSVPCSVPRIDSQSVNKPQLPTGEIVSETQKSLQLVSQTVIRHQPSTALASSIKPLSLFNPLDYLRLLWWVLVMPQQLLTYRQVFGETKEKYIGTWLVSTLIWWTLLIPTLATGLGWLPHSVKIPSAVYLLLSAVLIGCWLLMGGMRIKKAEYIILATVFCIALGIGLSLAETVGNVIVFSIPYAVTGIVALIVADIVAGGIVGAMVLVVVIGIVGSVIGGVAGGEIGFVSGCEVLVVAIIVLGIVGGAIENSLENNTPSWLARFVFLLFIIAHVFLIGLYFFLGKG